MGESIIERIEIISAENERSTRSFELSLGVSSGYINSSKKGKGNVGVDLILKILEKYPQYNLEWLITGNGSKYSENENTVAEASETYQVAESSTEFKVLSKQIADLQNTLNRRFIELEEGVLKTMLLEIAESAIQHDQILESLKKHVRD